MSLTTKGVWAEIFCEKTDDLIAELLRIEKALEGKNIINEATKLSYITTEIKVFRKIMRDLDETEKVTKKEIQKNDDHTKPNVGGTDQDKT